MSARTRLLVAFVSAPVIAFAIVGGFLGKVMAREDTYQHLRIFDDVTGLITSNYVEEANVDKVMQGAMHGLADALDPDSAYLSREEVQQVEKGAALPAGDVGLELTRQYDLRVIAARDGSPAAKAGLRTGDYVRMIDDVPTREMSVWEGVRALHGTPGTSVKLTVIRGSAADPHTIELKREVPDPRAVAGRMAAAGVGYLRIAAFDAKTPTAVKGQAEELTRSGARTLIIDIRRTSGGSLDSGLDTARLFVGTGTLAIREVKGADRELIIAATGDGSITTPATVLIDTGSSGASEVFAAALAENKRAELIGERTIGRAAIQKLVKLPDGSGLWLSTTRYLTPAGAPLHEKGLQPLVVVEEPEPSDFDQPAATADPILEKALERAGVKKAA